MIKRTGSVAEVRQQVKEWKKQGLTEDDFAVAARKEAERMRDEIVGCIGKIKLG